jgi:uncharacterized protein
MSPPRAGSSRPSLRYLLVRPCFTHSLPVTHLRHPMSLGQIPAAMAPLIPHIVRKALLSVKPVFRLNMSHGIHGLPHWSRVLWHGRMLASALDVDPNLLAWFAFLHDSQRYNEGDDPEHGMRAAEFAVKLRHQGVLTELDSRHFEMLCEAMRMHSMGYTESEKGIVACWDADRLDLGRVGITPAPHRLCTPQARHPQTIARAIDLSRPPRRPPRMGIRNDGGGSLG